MLASLVVFLLGILATLYLAYIIKYGDKKEKTRNILQSCTDSTPPGTENVDQKLLHERISLITNDCETIYVIETKCTPERLAQLIAMLKLLYKFGEYTKVVASIDNTKICHLSRLLEKERIRLGSVFLIEGDVQEILITSY